MQRGMYNPDYPIGGPPGSGGPGYGIGNGGTYTPPVNVAPSTPDYGGGFWEGGPGLPSPSSYHAPLPYVDPEDEHFASKTRGNIARAQWEDYKLRFRPYEDALFNAVDNPDVLNADLAQAGQNVNAAYDTAGGEYQRHLSRYGIQPSAAEQAGFQRQQALSQAGAMVAAKNKTRQNYRDRNMNILAGTGSGVSQLLNRTGG